MRGSGIEVIVIFFDVLAVVAFGTSQAEEALFQNGIAAVPESEGETDTLVIVANARDAVFGPAVGARTSVVVREVVPSRSVCAVIFAGDFPRRAR